MKEKNKNTQNIEKPAAPKSIEAYGLKGNGTSAATARRTRSDGEPSILGIFVGIVAIALALLLTIFALISISNKPMSVIGAIDGNEMTRVGNSEKYKFNFEQNQVRIAEGSEVVWYLDDEVIHSTQYHRGQSVELDFMPQQSGTKQLRVEVGKHYTKDITLNVAKPVLNFSITTYTMTYGDPLPNFEFECCGFVNQDCIEALNYSADIGVDCEDSQHLKVGVYSLCFNQQLQSETYESEYTCGTLVVEPRQISLNGYLSKEYDGTNILRGQKLNLVGVLFGDAVEACADTLYFEDKNVGSVKTVSTVNVQLQGEDADNYVLCKEGNNIIGRIYARRLTLVNTQIHSKMFDGTNSATFANIGELKGVVDGDVVALGGIKAAFENGEAGKGKTVNLSGICLVGSDKDNYVIDETLRLKADIANNYLDLILNKPQVSNAAVAADQTCK